MHSIYLNSIYCLSLSATKENEHYVFLLFVILDFAIHYNNML